MKNIKLKIAIIERGIPQYEIARVAEVSYLRITGFIGGYIKPRCDEQERLAKVLKCRPEEIFPDNSTSVEVL